MMLVEMLMLAMIADEPVVIATFITFRFPRRHYT